MCTRIDGWNHTSAVGSLVEIVMQKRVEELEGAKAAIEAADEAAPSKAGADVKADSPLPAKIEVEKGEARGGAEASSTPTEKNDAVVAGAKLEDVAVRGGGESNDPGPSIGPAAEDGAAQENDEGADEAANSNQKGNGDEGGDADKASGDGKQVNSGKKGERPGRLRGTALQLSRYIKSVQAHKYAYIFKEPFDEEEYPNFYSGGSSDKESMTLASLRQDVESGSIENAQDLYNKMMVMFDNAINYFKRKDEDGRATSGKASDEKGGGDEKDGDSGDGEDGDEEDDVLYETKELKHYAKQVSHTGDGRGLCPLASGGKQICA